MPASRRELLQLLATALSACGFRPLAAATVAGTGQSRDADLSPASWPPGEFDRYRGVTAASPKPLFEGRGAMMAGLTSPVGIRTGWEALRQGGSAIDAVMTAALSEIALTVGGPVSGAGEMVLLYFEQATGKVHSMNAAFTSVLDEKDPRSIPPVGELSGRAVLVPGFMAGLHAAHARFGRLPRGSLFGPAIFFAKNGITVGAGLARSIRQQLDVVAHYPEGRAIFLKKNGAPYNEGEILRQPQLADTLQRAQAEGPRHFYRGAWAEQLVKVVRREGGKLSLRDLERYDVVWSDPAHTRFRQFEVYGSGLPSYGGINICEAVNVAELADLANRGSFETSSDALYWMIQVAQLADLLSPPLAGSAVPAKLLEKFLSTPNLDPAQRPSKRAARALWETMQSLRWPELQRAAAVARASDSAAIEGLTKGWSGRKKPPSHTAGLVAIDRDGNLAVLMHSVNGSVWGGGLFVGGISIPDAAAFQQDLLAMVGPGARVPEWDNPTIVLRDGRPYMGSVSIGAAFHEVNVQNLLSVLELGVDPKTAVDQPQIRKKWPVSSPLRLPAEAGGFSAGILRELRARQLDVDPVVDNSEASPGGSWVGMRVDPTGRWQAGLPQQSNGWAIGE